MKKRRFTYFFDFIGALFRDHNVPMAIYFLANTALGVTLAVVFIYNLVYNDVAALVGGVGLYLIMLLVMFSPVGEYMLRRQIGGCDIDPDAEKRLEPLFTQAMRRAEKVNPNLDGDISLFMIQDDSLNAFAIGRRTIVINTGLLSLPNNQIAAILTHEIGHISHKDTDLRLAVTAGNGVISVVMFATRLVLNLIAWVASIFSRSSGIIGLFVMIIMLIVKIYTFIHDLFQKAWFFIGSLAMNASGRKQEFRADEFAVNCGASKGLAQFISAMLERQGNPRGNRGLLAQFTSSHPELRDRLVALANLGVPIEKPELLVE
ncbi:MAG: M48 family metalloprotease [Oscillospiraceae bacterium]|nr:M48 family metalloprotease [Oscillospiraceae bacterium]